MSQSHSNHGTNLRRGSGDNKAITVQVIHTSHIPSTSTIHKLSRGEMCNTLKNIRAYLKLNTNVAHASKFKKKARTHPLPLAITASGETASGTSVDLGFLPYDSIDSLQIQEPKRSRQLPWILESSKPSTTFNPPKPPKNSAASNESFQKYFQRKPFSNSRFRWEGSSIDGSIYTSSSVRSTSKTEQKPCQNPNKLVQNSAIYRFQRFLERNRKPPPIAGVKVCIQPEIAPEVMLAIKTSYDKYYGSLSTSECVEQHFDKLVDNQLYEKMQTTLSFPASVPPAFSDGYKNMAAEGYNRKSEINAASIPMHQQFADQNPQSYPYYQVIPNYWPTHHQHQQFESIQTPHFKRRTKFTMKKSNMFPNYGTHYQHYNYPNPEALYNNYQNTLMNQYCNYYTAQPPSHRIYQHPQQEEMHGGDNYYYHHPQHPPEDDQYYHRGDLPQLNSSYPSYPHPRPYQFVGY